MNSLNTVIFVGLTALSAAPPTFALRPLTVADAVETTRVMSDWNGKAIFVSPDSKRYVLMLVRGDVGKNGLWMELQVGGLDSLESAKPRVVARLFTSGLGGNSVGEQDATELVASSFNPPIWIDNRRIGFYWEDAAHVKQLISLDTSTGTLEFLTHQRADVVSYGVGPHSELVYGVKAVTLSDAIEGSGRLIRNGFSVSSASALELPLGVVDGKEIMDLTQDFAWYVTSSTMDQPRIVRMSGGGINLFASRVSPSFSADGKLAIVDGTPSKIPETWRKYSEGHLREMFADRAIDPRGGYARQFKKLFVVDLQQGAARPLWDVPSTSWPLISWSPTARSVLISPSFSPTLGADASGLAGEAAVEVNVSTGEYIQLPVPGGFAMKSERIRWISSAEVELLAVDGSRLVFRKRNHRWRLRRSEAHTNDGDHQVPWLSSRIQMELRQDVNTPPNLYAVDRVTGREQMVLEINPKLRTDIALGKVQFIRWTNLDGLSDTGRLYFPLHYVKGARYPLVVQTHGVASGGEFSLYGPGGLGQGYGALGPGSPVHLAQLLAAHDIAVLQLGDAKVPDGEYEPAFNLGRYEAAIGELVSLGIVDRTRVGLTGHSRSGWYVEYAISHSEFPFASAIASDNIDGSYFQAALSGWSPATGFVPGGAPPFGNGLVEWLKYSPPFNVERVHAPLQLQVMSEFSGMAGPVFDSWEMFSRLRFLKKPVELYVAPDATLHGSHLLQNPGQVTPLQERSLDWLVFWLTGEEDHSVGKTQQYESWRQLRILHDTDLRSPDGRKPESSSGSTPQLSAEKAGRP